MTECVTQEARELGPAQALQEARIQDNAIRHEKRRYNRAFFAPGQLEHRDIGLAHEAELAPAYRLLSGLIKAGCKAAIAASERI